MRLNIIIDDALMAEAMKAYGAKTKREVVELGLKALVRCSQQAELRKLRGPLNGQDMAGIARAI